MTSEPTKQAKVEQSVPSVVCGLKIHSKRNQEPPLPRPFPLPTNYRQAIAHGLKEGKLVGFQKAKLISTVANAILAYKSYPTGDELQHVALQMLKKWPFLAMANGDHVCSVNAYASDIL